MIISEDTTDAKLVGSKRQQHYTLQASAAVFDSMFKNLYSHPIESIVREIYTNALEVTPSPAQAPILTLPNPLDVSFSVRDFGPGMSEEFIFSIYTQGGASTKRTTNDAIGGFGFGSKSGFAYSDSFTVTSWHQGVKTIYLMYRDEHRIPSVSKIQSEDSPEHSGVEFKIASKQGDLDVWKNACASQLRAMPILPIIKRAHNFQYQQDPKTIFEHENIKLVDTAGYYFVRMGGPIYQIQVDRFGYNSSTNKFAGFWIDAPIGSVDLTPSREALNFSPKTNAYLEAQYDKIKGVITAKMQVEFDACKTNLEAVTLHRKKAESLSNPLYRNSVPTTFNGRKIEFDIDITPYFDPATKLNHRPLWQHASGRKFNPLRSLHVDSNYLYIVTPEDNFHIKKLECWYANNPTVNVHTIKYDEHSIKVLPDNLKQLEGMNLIFASQLPLPPKVAKVRLKENYNLLQFSPPRWGIKHHAISHSSGGIYVFCNHKDDTLSLDGITFSKPDITDLVHLMDILVLRQNHCIAAIPLTKIDAFKKDTAGWKSLKDHIQEHIDAFPEFKLKIRPYAPEADKIFQLAERNRIALPPFLNALRLDMDLFSSQYKTLIKKYNTEPAHLADLKKLCLSLGFTHPVNPNLVVDQDWQDMLALCVSIKFNPLLEEYIKYHDWRTTAALDIVNAKKLVSLYERT